MFIVNSLTCAPLSLFEQTRSAFTYALAQTQNGTNKYVLIAHTSFLYLFETIKELALLPLMIQGLKFDTRYVLVEKTHAHFSSLLRTHITSFDAKLLSTRQTVDNVTYH